MRFTNKIFIFGVVIYLILSILPVYDTSNVTSWTQLSLSFNNNQPIFLSSLNPQQFFTTIFLIPLDLTYEFTQSIYLAALILKLTLLSFFMMAAVIFNKVLYSYDIPDKNRNILFCLFFLNPTIIFVNFIWAEVDIIPAFFVLLSIYFLRSKPLKSTLANEIFFTFSIVISTFFFIYPLLLIPSFLIYTKNKRKKINLFVVLLIFLSLSLIVSILLFRGSFYNYVASFTGSKTDLAPGGLQTGLYYYIHLPSGLKVITEILLIAIVSVIIPILLWSRNVSEFRTEFIILSIFLFIMPVINLDNFLFMVPFIFLALLNTSGNIISKRRIIWIILLFSIPLIFAPFIYSVNNVFGLFYWFYPLLHLNGFKISYLTFNNIIIPIYNLLFLIFLITSIWAIISDIKPPQNTFIYKEKTRFRINPAYTKVGLSAKKKIGIIAVLIILLSVSFSLQYNMNDNSVYITNPNNFPIAYFYPEYTENSSIVLPIGQNSYSLIGNTINIPDSTPNLLLYRNISNQDFQLNTTIHFNFNENPTQPFLEPLAYTNSWQVGISSIINSTNVHNVPLNHTTLEYGTTQIPFFTNLTKYYTFNGTDSISYHINQTNSQNKLYMLAFKSNAVSSIQSIPINIQIGKDTLEVALYKNYGVVATYNSNEGWEQTHEIAYSKRVFNIVTFSLTNNTMSLNFDGYSKSVELNNPNVSITATLGNLLSNNPNYGFIGSLTGLLSANKSDNSFSTITYLEKNETLVNLQTNYSKGVIDVNFNSSPTVSNLAVNGRSIQTGQSTFIYLSKEMTNQNLYIKINQLSIHNTMKNRFFLVPAFLAFYFPIAFSIYSIYIGNIDFIYSIPKTKITKRN